MRLVLTQTIPAEPSHVWKWLTEPKRVNRWSTAKIRMVSPGEDGTAAGPGAVWDVTVRSCFQKFAFQEVIEASQPGERLAYRVVQGLRRRHWGEFRLTPHGEYTDVRWELDYQFPVPGLARVLSWIVGVHLRRCLNHLAGIVRHERDRATS